MKLCLEMKQGFVDFCAYENGIRAEIQPKHDDGQAGQAAVHGNGVGVRDKQADTKGGNIPSQGGDECARNLPDQGKLFPGEKAIHDGKAGDKNKQRVYRPQCI